MTTFMNQADLSATLPASTVKRRFLELLKQLDAEQSVVTITRNGVAAGVLMSVDEYETLLETLEVLGDGSTMRQLQRARRSFARGKVLRHDQVWPAA